MTSTLILLRHGESTWNSLNLFTGWVDVPLSEKGGAEADSGGKLLVEAGLLPDVLHTSVLRRAISTANLALDVSDRHWIPVRRHWRLNERHYGDLQGKDKKQTLQTYGEEQFMLWRRSYDVPPPPIERRPTSIRRPATLGTPIWATRAEDRMPGRRRGAAGALPARADQRRPGGRPDSAGRGARQLAAGGGQVAGRDQRRGHRRPNIPTGQPLRYDLDADLRPLIAGGTYLDPEAAAAAAAAVANQGR